MTECENCGKVFSSPRGMSIHLAKCKYSNISTSFCCQFCSRSLTTKRGLVKHEAICSEARIKEEEAQQNELQRLRSENEALKRENEKLRMRQSIICMPQNPIIIDESACNKLDLSHFLKGPKGLAKHCLEYLIKGDIFKTDQSRKVITYIPEGSCMPIKDQKGEKLARSIYCKSKHRIAEIEQQMETFDSGKKQPQNLENISFWKMWSKKQHEAINSLGLHIASLAPSK